MVLQNINHQGEIGFLRNTWFFFLKHIWKNRRVCLLKLRKMFLIINYRDCFLITLGTSIEERKILKKKMRKCI